MRPLPWFASDERDQPEAAGGPYDRPQSGSNNPRQFAIGDAAGSRNEYALITAIRLGDRSAFRRLFEHYYPKLVHFATRILGDTDLAEEAAQEIFLKVWNGRDALRESASLAPYLYRAVLNQCRTYHTAAANRQATSLDIAQDSLASAEVAELDEAPADKADVVARIRAVVDRLPDQPRRVFVLHYEHAMTHDQIAAVLDLRPKSVSAHLSRALAAIRRQLRE